MLGSAVKELGAKLDAKEDLITLDNGCACCTVRGDLIKTFENIAKQETQFDAVVIELSTRNKKKHVTSVRGLEPYGVDMTAAAKVFGKKYACGSAFQKGKNGLPDAIEIQGNYVDDLPPFIEEKYGIVLAALELRPGGDGPRS